MKERYQELDLLKGLTIIMILFYHSFQLKTGNIVGKYFFSTYIAIIIIEFMMPLFFLVSGFLANTGKECNLKKYYLSKFNRLVIPYFFINFIDYFPRTFFPNLVNSEFIGIKGVLFYGTKITWFLYTLIIIFLFFPFLERIWKKDKYGIFLLLLIIINCFDVINNIKILKIGIVIYQLIYFYIGYKIKNIYRNKIYNGKWTTNKTFVIISIIYLGGLYNYSQINIFTKISFALLAILFSLNIVKRIKNKTYIYKILLFFGVNSLTFYLLDGFVAVIYRTLLSKFILINNEIVLVFILFFTKTVTLYIITKFIIIKSSILCFLLGARKE